jgi:Putative prokaryotic signal transducing protein
MRELLRTHSISYAQGMRLALEAQGIKAVLLDENAPGYMGFFGKVRIVVPDEADYERAMAVVRALEAPTAGSAPPPSWKVQRWGLIAGLVGFFGLIYSSVAISDTTPRLVVELCFAGAISLMIAGMVLVALGPRRDRPSRS